MSEAVKPPARPRQSMRDIFRERGPLRSLRYGAEAIAAYLVYFIFRLLPLDTASALGGWTLRRVGPLLRRTRDVALPQLAAAFPEKSAAAHRQIMLGMWENLGRVMGEYPHLDEIGPRVTVVGVEHLRAAREAGAPILFALGHLANWEVPAILGQRENLPAYLVYRAPNNPWVARLLYRARKVNAHKRQIAKGATGAREIAAVLRRGGAVGMLLDQKMTGGMAVPFFGRQVLTAPAAAMFALKYRARVLPMRVERLAGAYFRLTVEPPLPLPESGTDKEKQQALMTELTARLEGWVRAHPSQWLWTHRRW